MGEQHVVHLGRVVTGCAQVAQHLAQAGPEAGGGAGIHQGQVVAPLHQVGVDCGLQALAVFGHIPVVEQPGHCTGIDPGQFLPAQCHGAVEQRGDLQRADLLVVDAGHLCRGRVRGGGQRRAGGRGQQQGRGK